MFERLMFERLMDVYCFISSVRDYRRVNIDWDIPTDQREGGMSERLIVNVREIHYECYRFIMNVREIDYECHKLPKS
jgi:hypothetical protein